MNDLFGNQEIKALSWKEPFATMMLYGKIETRTWHTNYRGLVLICASKVAYSLNAELNICGGEQHRRLLDVLCEHHLNLTDTYGMAIGIGYLFCCRPMAEFDEDKTFVQYNPDLFCHIYRDVKAIKPFAWKGKMGWKTLTEEQKALIITQ